MKGRLIAAAPLLALLSGCFGGSDPESGPSPESARAQCDSFAARAIQASDLGTATSLAAQASQCYADLQQTQGQRRR